jgi:hypothetical protein
MQVGIVPNAHGGYTAVYLEDGDYGNLNLHCGPDYLLSSDLEAQIAGELRHSLLSYCWALRSWFGQWGVALAWAAASLVVLCTQRLWSYGAKTAMLYGWVYVLFFGDGVMALSRLLAHSGALRRARQIRKGLAQKARVWYRLHKRNPPPCNAGEGELEFVRGRLWHDQWYAPYYAEMLAQRPRLLAGFLPNRLTLLLQALFVGQWAPRPRWSMELGEVTQC